MNKEREDNLTQSQTREITTAANKFLAVVAGWKAQARELIETAQIVEKLESDQDAADASDMRGQIKRLQKAVESQRASWKRPLLDLGKRIDAPCKELKATLQAEDDRLHRLLKERELAAQRAREAAEAAERKRLADLEAKENAPEIDFVTGEPLEPPVEDPASGAEPAPAADPPGLVAQPPEKAPVRTGFSTSSGRVKWKWHVESFAALPDTFKMVDEKALNEQSRRKPKPREIPGVRWERDVTIVTRT